MNQQKIDELRDYYDTTDTSDQMDGGTWETDVEDNPMITTSLRLPKDVLDWVRAVAAAEHVKPTALIRQWVEEQHQGDYRIRRASGQDMKVEQRLRRLEHAVFDDSNVLTSPNPRSPSE